MGFFDRGAEAIRTGLRERLFEPRALRQAQRQAQREAPQAAPVKPAEPDSDGRAERGEAILAGLFLLEGWRVEATPATLWKVRPPSRAWAEAAHAFDWLADLDALGAAAARDAAAVLVTGWIDRHRNYETLAWRTDLAARRLWRWLGSDLVFAGAAEPAKAVPAAERVRKSIGAHVLWLERRWPEAQPGLEAVRVATALTRACLELDGLEAHRRFALERLDEALSDALAPDGVPFSRNPQHAFEIFERLLLLRDLFRLEQAPAPAQSEPAAGVDASGLGEPAPAPPEATALAHPPETDPALPPAMAAALPALAAALRFFRRPDGGLPLFHGGFALADGRLDAALARSRLTEPGPNALPQSGFLRFSGGRVSAIMDVGSAPAGPLAETRRAAPLAIELSSARRRMIVNCGAAPHLGGDWAAACGSLAGHSTLSIEAGGSERAAFAPREIAVDRRTERNGEWLFGAHDGFSAAFGVQLSRRMFLTADGGDFRGEDTVELHRDGGRTFEKRRAKLPRAARGEGLPFLLRFHLHPDVEAELVADGEAVALRLPHGENWVMRQAGGKIALAPSFYLDQPSAPRPSRQIVVTGSFTGEQTHIRWAFRRVGELAQQPRDVDALLEAARGPLEGDITDGGGAAGAPLDKLGRPPFSA